MRKAIAETALVAIILAVAGGLVLGGVAVSIIGKGRGQVDLNACRSNVALAVKSKQTIDVRQCYTREVGSLDYSGNRDTYTEEMASQVARYLYECRYQFGESAGVPWKGNVWSNIHVCSVCSTFSLPAEGKGEIRTDDIIKWMREHKLSTGPTYEEYLKPSAPANKVEYMITDSFDVKKNVVNIPDSLKKDVSYAVVYWTAPQRRLVQITGIGVDIDWGVKIESTDSGFHSVFLTRVVDVNKACEYAFTRTP